MINKQLIHNDLLSIQTRVFDICHFKYSTPVIETESAEYSACQFMLNDLSVRFRVSKITPTKVGQFVALWKRTNNGPIEPFDSSDSLDLVIINSRNEEQFGQFIFPRSVLCEQGILSHNDKEGKRAIRVYPPWDKTTNKQAQKTQKWQLNYFLNTSNTIDIERATILYGSALKL